MKRILNFHRNKDDNCKTVLKWLEESDTLMWIKKTNTIVFSVTKAKLENARMLTT